MSRDSQATAALQKKLAAALENGGTAISAALVHNGDVVAAGAQGTAEGAPATIHDLYNIGSVSKVYCAAAIMKLVEQGLAELDAPVCRYLPDFIMKDIRYRQITLRMCLNHTSGLPGTGMRLAFTTRWMYDAFEAAMLDYLAHATLKADPGAYSVYCNDGFDLAGMVVSRVSGMSYTGFLRRYILDPLAAPSTCSGEGNPAGRTRVRERGCPVEYLNCVGSGGIATDLTDCARFGYLFADPAQSVLKPGHVREITRPQGRSFLEQINAHHYGLGWDSVSLQPEGYDFGPGTLGKSGGTGQFSSYLLVSPRHRLSAAISVTKDAGVNALTLLADIAADYLEAQGISCRAALPVPPPAPRPEKNGLYYGNRCLYRVSEENGRLDILAYHPDGWKPFMSGGEWDGHYFAAGDQRVTFERHGQSVYLLYKMPAGTMTLAQRLDHAPPAPLPEAWRARIGKSYLVRSGSPFDLDIGDMVNGITIRQPEDSGILLFCGSEAYGSWCSMPARPINDRETDYVLDGPGSPGSRDTFAPFVEVENGIETLCLSGVRYIDASALPALAPGQVTARGPHCWAGFRIRAGTKLSVEKPEHVRMVMLDRDTAPYYDELRSPSMPEACDGYLLFISDRPFTGRVQIEN